MEPFTIMVVLTLLFGVPVLDEWISEPAPGFTQSVSEARRYRCQLPPQTEAQEGERFEERVRYFDVLEVRCQKDLLREGLRLPRDHQLLRQLSRSSTDLVARLVALHGTGGTWVTEVAGFNTALAGKIQVAVENALNKRVLVNLATDSGIVSLGEGFLRTQEFEERLRQAEAFGRTACAAADPSQSRLMVIDVAPYGLELQAATCVSGRFQWVI